MIISHKHKYLFIQQEKTASSAIAEELCENYSGKKILWKHARYEDFLKFANPKDKKNYKSYFKFAGIRNPLDLATSYYFIHKVGFGNKNKNNFKKYKFIKENDATFPKFFRKFYGKRIYDTRKEKRFNSLDYIYRYEKLQEEFSEILRRIGIKQKRPLPLLNKTPSKKENFELDYTPDIQPLAKIVFKKYMKKWNYQFPRYWKDSPLFQQLFIKIPLEIKYFLQRIYGIIIEHPLIYKRIYNFEDESSKTKI